MGTRTARSVVTAIQTTAILCKPCATTKFERGTTVSNANLLFFGEDFGRGSRVRTRDLRFWRPSLYQLSYTPKAETAFTQACRALQVQNRRAGGLKRFRLVLDHSKNWKRPHA